MTSAFCWQIRVCFSALDCIVYTGCTRCIQWFVQCGDGGVQPRVSYVLFRKKSIDNNILYLLIGITLSFISHHGTAAVAGAFHYAVLGVGSGIALLAVPQIKNCRCAICLPHHLRLHVAELAGRLEQCIWTFALPMVFHPLPIMINRGFITGIYAAAASFCLYFLLQKHNSRLLFVKPLLFGQLALLLLFLAGNIEIRQQFATHYPSVDVSFLYMQLYSYLFVGLLLMADRHRNAAIADRLVTDKLPAACLLLYFLSLPFTDDLLHALLQEAGEPQRHLFLAQWLVAALAGYFSLPFFARSIAGDNRTMRSVWILSTAVVVFLSARTVFPHDEVVLCWYWRRKCLTASISKQCCRSCGDCVLLALCGWA